MSLIKSKQRVADHGEVFTPPWMVDAMLDLVKGETERLDSRFLEPACGSGNFLVRILQRKMAAVEVKYGKSDFEKRQYALLALMCAYGVEILADNVAECRANMLEVLADYLQLNESDDLYRAATFVLAQNIIHGDALNMKALTGQPITFAEWGYLGKGKFQRRDFRLDTLTNTAAFSAKDSLWSQLGKHEIFTPVKTYPPMTVSELATAAGAVDGSASEPPHASSVREARPATVAGLAPEASLSSSVREARPATVAGLAPEASQNPFVGSGAEPTTSVFPWPDPPPITRGSCILRRSDVAQILQTSLLKMHGTQYELLAWCIMPNHVHVLVSPYGGYTLEKITQAWKSVSAHGINKLLGLSGQLWQHESFDHLVRTESSLDKIYNYIERNPVEAGLCDSPQDWKFSSAGCDHRPTSAYRFQGLTERRFELRKGEKLPHLEIPGSTYFVTWRLKDAVTGLAPEARHSSPGREARPATVAGSAVAGSALGASLSSSPGREAQPATVGGSAPEPPTSLTGLVARPATPKPAPTRPSESMADWRAPK